MAGLLKEKWKEFCPHKAKWMKVTAAVFVLALVCAITVPIVYANAEDVYKRQILYHWSVNYSTE